MLALLHDVIKNYYIYQRVSESPGIGVELPF